MNYYKFFYVCFLSVLIFNSYKSCFSFGDESQNWRILEVDLSLPKKNNLCLKNNAFKQDLSLYNPPVYKSLERAAYTKMSPQQFKEYFKDEVDEERILNNYEFFAFESFRSFARSLPSYQKFMCSLDEKINNDEAFRARTAQIEGFDYNFFLWWETSGFHDFVKKEAERIRKTNPHGYFDYSSQVPPPIPDDRYAAVFKNTYGTALDCKLHKELHQTRTTMIQLERTFLYNEHVRLVAPVVHHLAARAKAEKNLTTAWELSKLCRTVTSVV